MYFPTDCYIIVFKHHSSRKKNIQYYGRDKYSHFPLFPSRCLKLIVKFHVTFSQISRSVASEFPDFGVELFFLLTCKERFVVVDIFCYFDGDGDDLSNLEKKSDEMEVEAFSEVVEVDHVRDYQWFKKILLDLLLIQSILTVVLLLKYGATFNRLISGAKHFRNSRYYR